MRELDAATMAFNLVLYNLQVSVLCGVAVLLWTLAMLQLAMHIRVLRPRHSSGAMQVRLRIGAGKLAGFRSSPLFRFCSLCRASVFLFCLFF